MRARRSHRWIPTRAPSFSPILPATARTAATAPGGGSKPHRHNSYVLVYVLEGAVEMKLRGAPLVTVRAGESFVERPDDVHEVSRNASQTERAKFLVVALKPSAQPLSVPVASR